MGQFEVEITDKVKAKSLNMMSVREVQEKLENMQGTIFKRKGENEYHLKIGNHNTGRYILVFKVEDGKLIAVTQMGRHLNYHQDSNWLKIKNSELRGIVNA